MFLEMWNFIRDTDESYEKYLRRNTAFQSLQKGFVQPYSDTPLDNVTLGENVYMNILKTASRYVYITTPYLIIDNEMQKELCMAAERGMIKELLEDNDARGNHRIMAAVIGAIMKLPGAPRALAVAQLKSRYLENLIGKMG